VAIVTLPCLNFSQT